MFFMLGIRLARIVLRLVGRVLRHTRLRGHGILGTALLDVVRVCQRLLGIHGHVGGHAIAGHVWVLGRHAGSTRLGRQVLI